MFLTIYICTNNLFLRLCVFGIAVSIKLGVFVFLLIRVVRSVRRNYFVRNYAAVCYYYYYYHHYYTYYL